MDRKVAQKIERQIAATDKKGFAYFPEPGERLNEFVLNELERDDRTLLPLTIQRNGKTIMLFVAFGTSIHHWWQIMTIATNAYFAANTGVVATNKEGIAKKLNDLRWSLQAQTKMELPAFEFLNMDKKAALKIIETIKL